MSVSVIGSFTSLMAGIQGQRGASSNGLNTMEAGKDKEGWIQVVGSSAKRH